jgi:hypothetical protein
VAREHGKAEQQQEQIGEDDPLVGEVRDRIAHREGT